MKRTSFLKSSPEPAPAKAFLSAVRGCLLVLAVLLALASQAARLPGEESEAKAPAADQSAAVEETPITADNLDHWAFRPLSHPAPPAVKDRSWPRGPIDRFILSGQEEVELAPIAQADRLTLLRRLSFDLTGLPPAAEEIAAFLADNRGDAYERQVDRLLASPASGEHFAQFWLDLARYAETDGFEHDKERPAAWRYRDWVIEAFNRDMPYDEFVQLQIAGDELRPGDESARIATGFCLAGPDMPDINSQDERRNSLLNEIAGTVGSSILGLQIGCAQCHDHKYDPLSQADFYRLRAVFEPSLHLVRDRSLSVLPEGAPKADAAPAPSRLMIRGDFRRPGPVVEPAYPRIANRAGDSLLADCSAWREDRGPEQAPSWGLRTALARWLVRPERALAARTIANRLWLWHFGEGLSRTPSDFGVLGDAPLHEELLDWLSGELVRRNWSMKQLHRAIVTSAAYRQASRPLESETAGPESGAADGPALDDWRRRVAIDPENRRWSRFPRRRLSGEQLRDAMLAVGGVLSLSQRGPSVRPPLPAELTETLLKDHWVPTADPSQHVRRSIYVFARRNLRYPIFEVFDRPDANASCPQRGRSVSASQSLLLINSEFSLEAARRLAGRAHDASEDPQQRATLAIEWALGRPASEQEQAWARDFLTSQEALLRSEGQPRQNLALPTAAGAIDDPYAAAALTDFCLALLCANEFLYID